MHGKNRGVVSLSAPVFTATLVVCTDDARVLSEDSARCVQLSA